jgi:hypothetical protein
MKLNAKQFIRSIPSGEGQYKIYAILSIQTGDIIYVGITKRTLGYRLSSHKTSMYLGTKDISIMLITNTDNRAEESYYIKMFSSLGFNLLNKNKGISDKINNMDKINKLTEEEKVERAKIRRKNYYEKNKEKLDNKNKKYQEENKERLKEYRKEYYREYYHKKIKNNE